MKTAPGYRALAVSGLLLLAGTIIPYLIWGSALEASFSVNGARDWMANFGTGAGLAGVGLLVADLALPIPSTLVMSALGLTFGTFVGGLYSAAGTALGGIVAYMLSRWLGRPLALRLAGEDGLRVGESLFAESGPWLVAGSRCLPILPEAIACLAGMNRMPFQPFLLSLLCGSVPTGFLFSAIGALGTQEPSYALALSVIVPVALWLAARRLLQR
jgi:uncharacterized membrane protein YdjX (TVP38/TMEM64 family)